MKWYWVDSVWTGFGMLGRTTFIPLNETSGVLSELYLEHDIMPSICAIFATTVDLSIF